MYKKLRLPLMATALLCSALPAWGQDAPKGKAMVEGLCNTCHPLSARVGSGYTAKGWHTVMRMMMNQGAPVPKDQLAAKEQSLRPRVLIFHMVTSMQVTPDAQRFAFGETVWFIGFNAISLLRLHPRTRASLAEIRTNRR